MDRLLLELKKAYGQDAKFRDGQREAIESILKGSHTLVVQKTGWGKSLVYFLATKILRKNDKGITIIISPLIALMNNQIDSADKLGLIVRTINSDNKGEWEEIITGLNDNNIDALIISPERLADEKFNEILKDGLISQIGLFVVDEAHCISDWGHDFRPDYRRIVDIVNKLPSNIPVLATTATANERVIKDIKMQLGSDLVVSRGSLMRESLQIQVIRLNSKEERLAWILKNINNLSGTGIIYCLTVNDCKMVNKWLNENGVSSESYYADIDKEIKELIVNKFINNEIKVLIATVALGMGFDKKDIGFVVHFQKPANIVSYYQQIGRAGRGIKSALAILLLGAEDDDINKYFIESAFPTEDLMNEIVEHITENPGIKLSELEMCINMKKSKIKKCIEYLLVSGDIFKENKKYFKTYREWKPDLEKSKEITDIRIKELNQMNEFAKINGCYMKYIADVLDDPHTQKCGRCANCIGHPLVPLKISEELVLQAQQFIKKDFNVIEPRRRWPFGIKVDGKNNIDLELMCEKGLVLSQYGDAGWGKLVSKGKYKDGHFDNQLVEASYQLLKEFVIENDIKWVTNIPSKRRPLLVKDFAERLSDRLGIKYLEVIEKVQDTNYQKELNTSYLQYMNVNKSFDVKQPLNQNLLLIDDMVDSRWTFTVCGYKLRLKGSGKVFTFALANSAGRNGDE